MINRFCMCATLETEWHFYFNEWSLNFICSCQNVLIILCHCSNKVWNLYNRQISNNLQTHAKR